MKKTIFIIASVLFLFSCDIIQQNKAVDYNNALITEQELVADELNSFIEMFSEGDSITQTALLEKRKEVMDFIDNSIKNVEKIGDFDNSSVFKESIIGVLQAYKNGVENEYTTMAQYSLLPIEEQTPMKYIESLNQAGVADSLISKAENDFIAAQVIFASEQNLELDETPQF